MKASRFNTSGRYGLTKQLNSSERLYSCEEPVYPFFDLCSGTSEYKKPLSNQSFILSELFKILLDSETAYSMIENIIESGWFIGINDCEGYDFCIDAEQKVILLNNHNLSSGALERSKYFFNTMLVSLVRALRMAWHEERSNKDLFVPEDILMFERVLAADSYAVTALTAWELSQNGHSGLWRHLIGSSEGDIAMVFANTLEETRFSFSIYKALEKAFIQWYQSEDRVNASDHESLEFIDLEIIQGGENMSETFFRRLSSMDIERLSCLPDKTAYLNRKGQDILSDPFFAGLDDEVNQAHMKQIVYDMRVTYVGEVPFQDPDLAARIFPDENISDPDSVSVQFF